jgi:hypothetical protein
VWWNPESILAYWLPWVRTRGLHADHLFFGQSSYGPRKRYEIMRHSVNVQHNLNFERKDVTPLLPHTLSERGWMSPRSAHTKPLTSQPLRAPATENLLTNFQESHSVIKLNNTAPELCITISAYLPDLPLSTPLLPPHSSSLLFLHLYPLLHHLLPFGVRASHAQRCPHWQRGQTSHPAWAGTTLRFTYFTCTVLQIFRQAVVLLEEKTWPSRNFSHRFNRPSLRHGQFHAVHTLSAQFSPPLLV